MDQRATGETPIATGTTQPEQPEQPPQDQEQHQKDQKGETGYGPPHAPDPTGPDLRPPRHRIERRAVAWWTVRAVIGAVPLLGIPLTVFALVDPVRPWLGPAIAVLALVALVNITVAPSWRYAVHRWETTDEAVYAVSGWLVREWRVAPLSRVQTVDAVRGPLQQLFKLATVTVTTASASGPVRLVGLDDAVATETANHLTGIVQRIPGDAT